MLSTEKAFEILPYISDIYEKLDFREFIKKYQENKKEDDAERRQIIAGLDIFAFIMKQSGKVKDEFFNIVAIAEDKDIEEIKKQSFAKTLKTIKDLFTDKDLSDFFKTAMQ
ncbi:hypothetical protein [Tissierella sp.]|uniref:hypothetical protein n=1 Tax=Tissierella sp. TaxID=41274 RepID=UPI00305375DF